MPKGCAEHATSLLCLLWLLQSADVWLHTYPCVRAVGSAGAGQAGIPSPSRCQEVSEGVQGGNKMLGNSEYPSWALNSIHLHAAAPELLEAALGRSATGWEWSALQVSRQGAGGRDGTPRRLCAGCRVCDGARKGACVHVHVNSFQPAAEHRSQEKPCLSYSSCKAALGHCQYLV